MDHKKFSKTNLYKCLFILPSILCHAPGAKAIMHPQIVTDPPPCSMVWWTCWGPTRSPSPIQHYDLPFEVNLFFFGLVIENHTFSIINAPISYFWANLKRARSCANPRISFICYTLDRSPEHLKSSSVDSCIYIATRINKHLHEPDFNLVNCGRNHFRQCSEQFVIDVPLIVAKESPDRTLETSKWKPVVDTFIFKPSF